MSIHNVIFAEIPNGGALAAPPTTLPHLESLGLKGLLRVFPRILLYYYRSLRVDTRGVDGGAAFRRAKEVASGQWLVIAAQAASFSIFHSPFSI
jgi:hypothetical protein